MSIGRVARGTNQGKSISTLSIAGVAVAAGSCLELALGFTAFNGFGDPISPDSVSWNGLPLTLTATAGLASSVLELYRLDNAPGGTGSLVADFSSTGPVDTVTMIATEITGPGTAPFDKSIGATGNGTAPNSGASPVTSLPNELLSGWFAIEGPVEDIPPSWLNGFSAGQRGGTTGGGANSNITLFEGFLIVGAIGSYAAAGSGMSPSRTWAALLLTFEEATAVVSVNPEVLTLPVDGDEAMTSEVDGDITLTLACGDPPQAETQLAALHWSAVPVEALTGTANSQSITRHITLAESFDGLNSYEELSSVDSGANGTSWLVCTQTLNAAAAGFITRLRLNHPGIYSSSRQCYTQAVIADLANNVLWLGSLQALTGSVLPYFDDLLLNPVTGTPWTAADLSAYTFGVRITAVAHLETAWARFTEFTVDVWGRASAANLQELACDGDVALTLPCAIDEEV